MTDNIGLAVRMTVFNKIKRRVPLWIKSPIKSLYLDFLLYRFKYLTNASIARGVKINEYTRLEPHTSIYQGSDISGSCIGKGTYIAANSTVRNTKVGRFCSIGANVSIGIGTHPAHIFVSTHPAFFSPGRQAGFTFVKESIFDELPKVTKESPFVVEIGNDVWVGNNAIILDGIRIADGAIVGAGAVVTKNVEPFSINIGVPAKCIGYRFKTDTISYLLAFKWWDRDFEWLRNNVRKFQNIDTFIFATEHMRG